MTSTSAKTGHCLLCGQDLDNSRVTHHLMTCLRRQTGAPAPERSVSISSADPERHASLIRIRCEIPSPDYYIHLLVRADATIRDIDVVTRELWLEPCCDRHHESHVTKGDQVFRSQPSECDAIHRGFTATLAHLWDQPGSGPDYILDRDLPVVCRLDALGTWIVNARHAVQTLARNNLPPRRCTSCGAPATLAWSGFTKRSLNVKAHFSCGDCAPKNTDWAPVANSPRTGACRYGRP